MADERNTEFRRIAAENPDIARMFADIATAFRELNSLLPTTEEAIESFRRISDMTDDDRRRVDGSPL